MAEETQPEPIDYSLIDHWHLCRLLGCPTRTVNRLVRERKIPPPIELDRVRRWRRSVIEQWIEAGCPECAQ